MAMDIIKIIAGAVVGTSLMTMFSYFASYQWKSPLREPVLLNKLLARSGFIPFKKVPNTSGWIIHYLMGIFLVTIYHFIWELSPADPTFLTGALFGFVNGFAGVAGWMFVLNLHSDPPFVNPRKYYPHLLVAHIIFGIGAVVGYDFIGL